MTRTNLFAKAGQVDHLSMTRAKRFVAHRSSYWIVSAAVLSAFLFVIGHSSVLQAGIAQNEKLKTRIELLSTYQGQRIGSRHIAAADFIQRFYKARNYQLAWNAPANIAALRQAIALCWMDGLQAEDFHASVVGLDMTDTPEQKLSDSDRDILLTDAFIRLLYQLYYGKVSPDRIDANWNYDRHLPEGDPVKVINQAITAGKAGAIIEKARLDHPYYLRLRATLKTYIEYELAGGWSPIDDGPQLKLGDKGPRVVQLRHRLAVTGEYLKTEDLIGDFFDKALLDSVKVFQHNNDIDVDGVVGPGTLRAMNISARQRIDQIRVNLERARWVIRSLVGHKDIVIVNIAGFYLKLFLDGQPAWQSAVITGKPYHKTPVFTEDMKYLVLNPNWGVPRSIIRNEIFPKAKADPAYLTSRNFQLTDAKGAQVDPQTLDWSSFTAKTFPYRVTQRPGEKNALGQVKFIFPNRFSVYLHDTPSRQLFSKTGRAFSHGCIRVKDPLKLAEIILSNRLGWSRSKIDQIIASRKSKRVNLPKPLPVAILYWTVDPGFDGTVRFYHDVYKRDARLILALNARFQLPSKRVR